MQTDGQKLHEQPGVYDWAAYYEASLYQLKRQNVETMLGIEASRAQEELLRENLTFIKNNPLWKLLMPLRAVCDGLDRLKASSTECRNEQLSSAYEDMIFGLKHPYQQWIRQIEAERFKEYGSSRVQASASFHYVTMKQCAGAGLKECLEQIFAGQRDSNTGLSEQYVVFTADNGIVREEAETVMRCYFAEHPGAFVAYADEDFVVGGLIEKMHPEVPAVYGDEGFVADGRHEEAERKQPEASAVYGDEGFIAGGQHEGTWRMHPWFKPGWSPETILSFFYFGSFTVIRADLLRGLRVGADKSGEVNLYDLVLQALEKCEKEQILHIEEVLFHKLFSEYSEEELEKVSCNRNWDTLQRLEAVLQRRLENGLGIVGCGKAFSGIKEAAFERRGIRARLVSGMEPDIYHIAYDMFPEEPMVSAVVLSKDHPKTLEQCLVSLVERTDYDRLEIIVVDNGSTDQNRVCIEKLRDKFGFSYIYKPMEFNFSAQCNIGVREAKGDVILLLNDDIEVIEKNWLRRMVGQAIQPEAGAVGARLLYAGTDKIQHAGITNLGVGPSHKLITCSDGAVYDFGRNRLTYNMLGVTAACLVVEKRKYEEVGGLCEDMRVAYNDVDFCFSLHEKGYRNILRNDALLYHYESLSRGSDVIDDEKWFRFLDEKAKLYGRHPALDGYDPYYHRDLADDSAYYICNFKCDADDKDKYGRLVKISRRALFRAKVGNLHLEVDNAGFVPRDHARNLDDYWISGWAFLPGADQCKYKKRLLFKNANKEIWEGTFFPKYRKDVEEMFAGEKHISGAGFSLRFVQGTLPQGSYAVGMLFEDLENGKRYVTWSGKTLVVE